MASLEQLQTNAAEARINRGIDRLVGGIALLSIVTANGAAIASGNLSVGWVAIDIAFAAAVGFVWTGGDRADNQAGWGAEADLAQGTLPAMGVYKPPR